MASIICLDCTNSQEQAAPAKLNKQYQQSLTSISDRMASSPAGCGSSCQHWQRKLLVLQCQIQSGPAQGFLGQCEEPENQTHKKEKKDDTLMLDAGKAWLTR